MNDTFLDIRYLFGVLRRRWYLLAIPAVLGGLLSVVVAYLIPPVYMASARILVESQQIPSDLARSTVASNAEERVSIIEQRLKTRQNLLDLAEQFDVFRGRGDLSPTEIVDRMREALQIRSETFSRRRNDRNVSTIEISFRANEAAVSAQVANAVLTQLLQENVEQRSARASETLAFFTRDVDRLGAELDDLEQRISTFKNENQDALPESLPYRRSELSALNRQEFDRETRRLQLEERKRLLEEQIELGRSGEPTAAASPEARELANLRTALAQQRAIYADTHPNIRQLTARIAALAESIEQSGAVAPVADEGAGDSVSLIAELERIDNELSRLDSQEEIDAARIEELEASIARTPLVEIELGALSREYGSLQVQYREALAKKAEAETGERLEVNRQAERFEIIEQPQAPDKPVAPNRVLIAGAGGVLSVGLGFALMVLAELLNPALWSSRDLERRLSLRPVVTIPYIRTQAELSRRKWRLRLAILAVLVLPALALFLADQYVLPLPVLAERLMERSGLGEMVDLLQMRFGE